MSSTTFATSSGAWDVAGNWSPSQVVPDGNSAVTINATTTLLTVGGTGNTAASLIATGTDLGGTANTISISGTLGISPTGGAGMQITDFYVTVGSVALLDTSAFTYTGSTVDISGKESFGGGVSSLNSGSALTVEAGATLSGDELSITDSDEYIYGLETLSNGGGGTLSGDLSTASITIESTGTLDAQQLIGSPTDTLIVEGHLSLTGGGPELGMSATIDTGGTVIVDGYQDDSTTWVMEGGTFVSGNTWQNGTFDFSTLDLGGTVALYDNNQYNTGVYVSDFDTGDIVILGTAASTDAVTAALSSGVLTLTQDSVTVATISGFSMLNTIATPLATVVSVVNPNTGTVENHYEVYMCFYPGTRLATAAGEIEVEQVRPGTMLKTAAGAELPVRWVGWSEVSLRFADRLRSLPIRIRAGALADGVPSRDLLVSPDHALCMGGVLVQAAALINGTSIIREENVPQHFRYYHVELATHELLLAENCPAESFVDNIDRMHFHNWDEREAPRAPVPEMELPRAKSARQVPARLRAELAARAAQLAPPRAA